MKLKEKLAGELQGILLSTELFRKEHLAITLIKDFIEKLDNLNDKKLKADLLYETWKYYRVFKMKEFIYLFKDRIKVEAIRIDSPSNKTIQMLDAAFLWYITNWSNDSIRKYEQRFYSDNALV